MPDNKTAIICSRFNMSTLAEHSDSVKALDAFANWLTLHIKEPSNISVYVAFFRFN